MWCYSFTLLSASFMQTSESKFAMETALRMLPLHVFSYCYS